VQVDLFSFIDNYGVEILLKSSLKTRNCVLLPIENTIPVKRRLYHGEFPLCRWDIERPNYGWVDVPGRIELEKHQRVLLDKFLKTQTAGVVILSDYNKGVFSNAKKMWVRDDRPVIVDPKKGSVEDWEGCYIFKPNNTEAIELSGGITDWKEQCRFFYRTLKCKAVVITRGEDSVVGIIDGHTFEYKSEYRPNADSMGYSGAGDCFVAFLAMGIAHNLDIEEASALAFNAAAIYVGKRHNDPVTPQELLRLIDEKESVKQMVGKYASRFNEEEKELFFEELRKL
jgi:bifunctional ADP-heptose synthase (sugar kinase/adenylyltransferase)